MSNDSPVQDLAGRIERLASDGRYRPDEWLRFLTLDVLAGFGKRLDEPWDSYRQERLYALAGRYGELVAERPWRDLLGAAYMQLGSRGQQRWLGQFFTPQSVADLLAELNFCDLDLDNFPPDRFVRVMEPASGAGVMLLSVCGAIAAARGPHALRRLSLTAIDLDGLCAHMTACQLLANAALHGPLGEILVYRGNALGPDSALEVVVGMAAAPRFARAEPLPEIRPSQPCAPCVAPRAVAVGEQLRLFADDDLPVPPLRRRA